MKISGGNKEEELRNVWMILSEQFHATQIDRCNEVNQSLMHRYLSQEKTLLRKNNFERGPKK